MATQTPQTIAEYAQSFEDPSIEFLSEDKLCEKYARTPYGCAFDTVRTLCPTVCPIFDIADPAPLLYAMRNWLKKQRTACRVETYTGAGIRQEIAQFRADEMKGRHVQIAAAADVLEQSTL